jgi:acyl-CoA thioester hydrolase
MNPRTAEKGGLGHFEGKAHILPIRVYYEDTDLSGVVYHANYLRFMERGRTEFFRMAGVMVADFSGAEPSVWTIRRAEVEFLRPARLDDALHVRSELIAISGARLNARQRIYAGENLLSDGLVEACIVTLSGKPRRIPDKIRQLLMPFLYETEA